MPLAAAGEALGAIARTRPEPDRTRRIGLGIDQGEEGRAGETPQKAVQTDVAGNQNDCDQRSGDAADIAGGRPDRTT
jgi:hypothetical protein